MGVVCEGDLCECDIHDGVTIVRVVMVTFVRVVRVMFVRL